MTNVIKVTCIISTFWYIYTSSPIFKFLDKFRLSTECIQTKYDGKTTSYSTENLSQFKHYFQFVCTSVDKPQYSNTAYRLDVFVKLLKLWFYSGYPHNNNTLTGLQHTVYKF